MKKQNIPIIIFIILLIIKIIFKSNPLVVKYIVFRKWIPFMFFAGIIYGEIKEKGFHKSILQRTWHTILYLVVRALDIAGITIPYLTAHVFAISLIFIACSIIYYWMQSKSYEKAVGKCLPKRTALMSQFETRLLKGLIKFIKTYICKREYSLNASSKRLLIFSSFVFVFLTIASTIATFKFYQETKYILLSWTLLPYILSWPIGILQQSNDAQIIRDNDFIKFSGLFNFKTTEENILNIKKYQKGHHSKSLTFSPIEPKEIVIYLKEKVEINVYGRATNIKSIVLSCEMLETSPLSEFL